MLGSRWNFSPSPPPTRRLEELEPHPSISLDMGKIKKLQSGEEEQIKILNVLTSKDLVKMTNNFGKENLIGSFQFGKIYRGFLEDQHFTVKIWDPPNLEYPSLQNHECIDGNDELVMLRHQRLVHPCIVSLYGYCRDKENLGVVYNLNPMDSLPNLLPKDDFTWLQRIKAAFALACLLKFFQAKLGDLDPFLIRNLCAAHLILDEEYNLKLVDFSMITGGIFPNRQVYTCQPAYGSFGYLDCDLIHGREQLAIWTKKSDVFAFGIILINLLSKKFMTEDDPFLDDWAYSENEEGKSLVHYSLQGDPFFYDRDGCTLSELGVLCTSSLSVDRPTMNEVLQRFLNLRVFKNHKELLGVDKMCNVNKKLHPSASLDMVKNKKPLPDTEIDYFSCDRIKDINEFYVKDLKRFTNNFSPENCIGMFKFGKLFRGVYKRMSGDVTVIVKIWNNDQAQHDNLLKLGNEMLLLHHEKYICHPGMIRMYGYCIEDEHVAIVLYFKAMDSMHNLLPRDDFSWLHRTKAACGVASLLKFLHDASHGMDPFIIRNLNAAHILLDEHYNPKLIDFGLITGGIFPNQPMDDISDSWTTKSDVLSFGLLLLSLISKTNIEEPIRLSNEPLVYNDGRLATSNDSVKITVHKSLQEDPNYDDDDGQEITRLVEQCVQSNVSCRPTMSEVVETFRKLKVTERHSEVMGVEQMFQDKCTVKSKNPSQNMPKSKTPLPNMPKSMPKRHLIIKPR